MSKFKNWMKENGLYVLGGLATAGVMAAAVIKGLKPGDSNSNLLTIDTSKDDWMNSKELHTWWYVNGPDSKELTVKEALCLGILDGDIYYKMKDRGLLTEDLEEELIQEFSKEHSGVYNVLDNIEGLWEYTKTEE